MSHGVRAVVAVFLLAVGVASADAPKTELAKELQGTWQAVALEGNGGPLPDDQAKELQLVIQGDRLDVKPDGEGRKTTFKVDATQTPATIDLTPSDGSRKGTVVPGICSLEKGKLRLCINIFGSDPDKRPTEFKTQMGDGTVLVTLERVNPK